MTAIAPPEGISMRPHVEKLHSGFEIAGPFSLETVAGLSFRDYYNMLRVQRRLVQLARGGTAIALAAESARSLQRLTGDVSSSFRAWEPLAANSKLPGERE